jgi:mannose-6-phosphate isomerase-like protein (cupin superfamily)
MTTTYEDGLGGSITILEEGGEDSPMRFRMVMPKGFGPPAPERHPRQREDFVMLRGELDLGAVNGEHVVLREGDTFTLPANVYHLPACGGDEECEFESTLTPGLDAAEMFRSIYTETRSHSGIGQFARVAMTFRRHTGTISFKLPVRVVMTMVAAVARWLGVAPTPHGVTARPEQTTTLHA